MVVGAHCIRPCSATSVRKTTFLVVKEIQLPRPLRPIHGVFPKIADDVFVADNAIITGDVEIGAGSSVWFGVVMRGDNAPIRIGERTNIQDGTIIHVDADAPVSIGNNVTIGHRAIIHGTTIGDGVQVGMGSVILSRSVVEPESMVGASALVPEGAVVESGTVVMGVPAKPRRALSETERARVLKAAAHYAELAQEYRALQDAADAD